MSDTIDFTVISYNLEGNSIIVKPNSPNFKNDPNTYPVFNLQISTLDQNQDLLTQIAHRVSPIIDSILLNEADTSSYAPLISSLSSTSYSIPVSTVNQYNNSNIVVSSGEMQQNINIVIEDMNKTFNNMLSTQIFENIKFLN
jgi:hypothetical protein